MVFGRYRFSFQHPEDFAPATLSGARAKGFVRLQADADRQIYVRWFPTPKGDVSGLSGVLRSELDRLGKQAKRRNERFTTNLEDAGGILRFGFSGSQFFAGFGLTTARQTYVIAATGKTTTAARRLADSLIESFDADAERDRWAMLGLDVSTPGQLRVMDQTLLSGRTTLTLGGRGVKVKLERWALAKQILDRHELDEWGRATLGLSHATVEEVERGVSLSQSTWFGATTTALLDVDAERNQIQLIQSTSRHAQWKPTWDWFNG